MRVDAPSSSSLDYCIQLQSLRELDPDEVGRYSDGVVTDMAKKRSIERALRKADKPPPPEHDALPDLLFVVDSKGRICDTHPSCGTLFRLPPANFVGRTVRDFLPEDTAAIISDAIADARQRGMHRGSVYPLDTPTGLRWFELSIVPWHGDKVPQGSLIAVARDITKRKRAEDDAREKELALQTSQARLRALSRRIESVREETQSQIAREIHDSIGQSVSGIAMSLGWIARRLAPTADREVSRELKDMETVLSGLTTKVQEMTMRLRPQILDDLGLKEAITVEVQGFSERTNIQGTVSVSLPPHALDDAGNTAVFRICQEALTNVYRHAKATAVLIVLYEQGGRILFAVSDNGRGITDEQVRAPKSLGILGMQERALALGGEIDFTGQPGAGTTVTLSLPIARKSGNRRRKPS